jgi:hypothetical protein
MASNKFEKEEDFWGMRVLWPRGLLRLGKMVSSSSSS